MAIQVCTTARRIGGSMLAMAGLLLSSQAWSATQCVNPGAPAPLEICVQDDATPGVWVDQPNGRTRQYYGEYAWGSSFYLGGSGSPQRFSSSYFGHSGMTPVSNSKSGSGTAADPHVISTVVSLGTTGLRFTQQFRYVNGDRYFSKIWTLENTGATTHGDLRFFHGGDTYFGGDDQARSWYDADLRMVYVNNETFSNSGYMAFYANPLTPHSRYHAGSYYDGYMAVSAGELPDTADSTFLDAGYYLQWNRLELRPGETWRIEAFETWSPPGSLQLLAPGDENVTPATTVRKAFKIHNLSAYTPLSLTWSASDTAAWGVSLPGGNAASLAPLQVIEVPVDLQVPAGVSAGDSTVVTLTVSDGALNTSSGSTRARIPVTDYSFTTRSMQFGTGVVGQQTELVVTLVNGSQPVSIGQVGAANPLATPFTVIADTCSNATVPAGSSCMVTVRFAPSVAGEFTDSFGIPVAGTALVNETIAVAGEAIETLYTVSAGAGAGGAISPTSTSVLPGSTAAFTVTPDTGYRVDSVGGCAGTLAGNLYTTGPVMADCAVTASFARIAVSLGVAPVEGGQITTDSTSVYYGDAVTFTMVPDTGYRIAAISGCGGTLAGNLYTTGPLTSACTITGSFQRIPVAVGGAGTLPGGRVATASLGLYYGDVATYTLTPEAGYRVASVSGCAGTLDGDVYTTAPLTSACEVVASFERIPVSLGGMGDVPGGRVAAASTSVYYGDVARFTLMPAHGYVVDSVSGCPGSLQANEFLTSPLTADCTLAVSFAQQIAEVSVDGRGAGGGGSTGWLGVGGLLLLMLRRWRTTAMLATLGLTAAAGAQAGEMPVHGYHFGASLGRATSNGSRESITHALHAQGHDVSVRLDDVRAAWRLHAGWSLSRHLGAEVGYSDLGRVRTAFAGSMPVLAVDDFLADAARVHPRTANGFDLSLVGRYAFNPHWSVQARAGVFRWDAERRVEASDGRVVALREDGANLLLGAGVVRSLTPRLDATAEWMRYAMGNESVRAAGLGLRYRW